MRVAIITSGNPNNMKGVMNYVQEKVTRLQRRDDIDFDFYMIRHRDTLPFSLIRGKKAPKKERVVYIKDIEYQNIWVKHSIVDYILTYKLHKRALTGMNCLKNYVDRFSSFDVIATHNLDAHYLASLIKKKYGIPFITTWHGSDINITPNLNIKARSLIEQMFKEAEMNYFVSKKLLETSNGIIEASNKDYLYTGPSDYFYKYNDEKINNLRKKHNITNQKVVGFIGNLVPIKNIKMLPHIFKMLNQQSNNFVYWIIGDGELEKNLINQLDEFGINYKMFGKVEPEKIPELMNCLDVLVLPSLNEGLPLVTLEALACGVNVVGSNVGGISESIGKENVFDLDDDFVENISNRIIEIIESSENPKPLSEEFSWNKAIEKEVGMYKSILDKA